MLFDERRKESNFLFFFSFETLLKGRIISNNTIKKDEIFLKKFLCFWGLRREQKKRQKVHVRVSRRVVSFFLSFLWRGLQRGFPLLVQISFSFLTVVRNLVQFYLFLYACLLLDFLDFSKLIVYLLETWMKKKTVFFLSHFLLGFGKNKICLLGWCQRKKKPQDWRGSSWRCFLLFFSFFQVQPN